MPRRNTACPHRPERGSLREKVAPGIFGVLQDDADYDTLAEVLPFESRWIAPRGSID